MPAQTYIGEVFRENREEAKQILKRAFVEHLGSPSRVAEALGITRALLRWYCIQLDLKRFGEKVREIERESLRFS